MDKNVFYAATAFAVAAFAFFAGKKQGKAGFDVGTKPDCPSALADDVLKSLAGKLRSIFDEWYITDYDESRIVDIFRQLTDSCSVKLLYHYFGYMTTNLYGSGDLDFWMSSRVSAANLDAARAFTFGLSSF